MLNSSSQCLDVDSSKSLLCNLLAFLPFYESLHGISGPTTSQFWSLLLWRFGCLKMARPFSSSYVHCSLVSSFRDKLAFVCRSKVKQLLCLSLLALLRGFTLAVAACASSENQRDLAKMCEQFQLHARLQYSEIQELNPSLS